MPNDPKSTTGGEFDVTQDGFQVHSMASEVGFDLDEADPPALQYIDLNDQLQVKVATNIGGTHVTISLRILGLDGIIHPLQFVQNSTGVRAVNTVRYPLMEGFLLSVSVQGDGTFNEGSFCYCAVGLSRSPFGAAGINTELVAGYVSNNVGLSYPESGIAKTTDGAGYYHSATQAAPAAGADIIYTVPVGARQRLVSFTASLTANATAANRLPALVIDDGANIVAQIPSGNTQLASTTATYTWGDGLVLSTAAAGVNATASPGNCLLAAGFRVRTLTAGIQGTDQWTAAFLLVGDWQAPV